MTTIRVERRDRWTTIDRETVNDSDLSFRARGILIWLLDKPDGWCVRSVDIEKAGAEGREAVRASLRELETCGYLERRRSRTADGRWITESVIRETPGQSSDGLPSTVSRPPETRTFFRRLSPKTVSGDLSTTCGRVREHREYDATPLTPEQNAEKWGCEA